MPDFVLSPAPQKATAWLLWVSLSATSAAFLRIVSFESKYSYVLAGLENRLINLLQTNLLFILLQIKMGHLISMFCFRTYLDVEAKRNEEAMIKPGPKIGFCPDWRIKKNGRA